MESKSVGAPRRLKGHKATATCCISSRERPGVVATSGEDGCICWFDMRCKEVQLVMEVENEPISSLCFKPGNEDIIYASSGKEVKGFDVRLGSSWKPLESYNYNKEEVNQITCSSNSGFLAAADDGGEIKRGTNLSLSLNIVDVLFLRIIDIRQQCLYKTLRSGHSSICSGVQFLPWKPWEVISGGLDSKLVMWDFSKGCPLKVLDFGSPEANGDSAMGQCFNPAFVHAVAAPGADMLDKSGKVCVVARGDGVVDVINVDPELASTRSKTSSKLRKGLQSRSNGATSGTNGNNEARLRLDYTLGGHTAAVSCVAFSLFGERGKFIISGGNDKTLKVWDWLKHRDQGETSNQSGSVHLNINLKKKVNWLCTTPSDSENLIVCDTTKVVKAYSIS